MLPVCMHPRVFFVTNHFQDERHAMHEDMRTAPIAHLVPPVGRIYLEYQHHTLGFWCRKAQKSKCGGDRLDPATGSFRTKDGASFALLKRNEKKEKRKKGKKREKT